MVEDDPGDLKNAVEQFRDLLKKEPELEVRTDDNFILRHLRSSDGNPEKAFAKMKVYYLHKRDHPEWYATEAPIAYKEFLEMGSDSVLEDRDPSGKRIWVVKAGKLDSSKMSVAKLSQVHDLLLETILDEPESQKNGMAVIVDLKDFPWSILRWLTPHNLKIGTKKADNLPFPKMEYHVVNTSVFFNVALKIVYPFLSTKQKEGLFIHGDNWASLHEKLDPSVLPKEYKGEKPSASLEKLYSQIYANTDQLLVNLNMGYKSKGSKAEEKENYVNNAID